MTPQTFKDLGLDFSYDSACITCSNGSCHTIVQSKLDGKEYSVHISVSPDGYTYSVTATENSSTNSNSDIEESFNNETTAVQFVCKTFDGFKCS